MRHSSNAWSTELIAAFLEHSSFFVYIGQPSPFPSRSVSLLESLFHANKKIEGLLLPCHFCAPLRPLTGTKIEPILFCEARSVYERNNHRLTERYTIPLRSALHLARLFGTRTFILFLRRNKIDESSQVTRISKEFGVNSHNLHSFHQGQNGKSNTQRFPFRFVSLLLCALPIPCFISAPPPFPLPAAQQTKPHN